MKTILGNAVGAGGKNDKPDVYIIQELLNIYRNDDARISLLKVDGDAGKNTKDAIKLFQIHVMKLNVPDSRIDPGGGTEKLLLAKLLPKDVDTIVKKYKPGAVVPVTRIPETISYTSTARRELSNYTEKIIKLAMFYSGVNKVHITSTRRTEADQARIMYESAVSFPNARDSAHLKERKPMRGWGYGPVGTAVEKVYFANKGKPAHEVQAAMVKEIQAQTAKGNVVSNHLVEPGVFAGYNVLDIARNTIAATKREEFGTILSGMASEVIYPEIVHKKNINMQDYITKLICEKGCWHLEIKQSGKELPDIPAS